jgi:Hsp70 protein
LFLEPSAQFKSNDCGVPNFENFFNMQTAHVGAIGIDLGSQRSVIAVAKKGGVEVLANEGSHRETPNIIGFGERERFIGEQGALQVPTPNLIMWLESQQFQKYG